MLEISYSKCFIKQYGELEKELKEEIKEKIILLKNTDNHPTLKIHKLHGKLSDKYSFSVNYKIRIVFEYISKNEITLLKVGDHDIYK